MHNPPAAAEDAARASDRELLDLAAKAAGYSVYFGPDSEAGRWKPGANCCRIFWNPLSEDGDAMRLSVDLRLKVYHADLAVMVTPERFSHEWMGEMVDADTGDRHAATRRVIVRAAAEIGRSMT